MNILNGKKIALEIREDLKKKIAKLEIKPSLAILLVGNDPASKIYVNMKGIYSREVGIIFKKYEFSNDIKEEQLIEIIKNLNEDDSINGILVQLPLPCHINELNVIKTINPLKDVDGLHPQNIGNLYVGDKKLVACTANGILKLLEYHNIKIDGKEVVIIGRSNIVGKPLAALMLEKNATVTICHSKTKNLSEKTSRADILIVAVGKPKLINEAMVKEGAVVVDVGVNRVNDANMKKGYYLCGDVDFDDVKMKALYISKVTGGVGPMTVAMLLTNTYNAYILQKKLYTNHDGK